MTAYKCKLNSRKYKVLDFSDVQCKQDIVDFAKCDPDAIRVVLDGVGFAANVSYIIDCTYCSYSFGPGCVLILSIDGDEATCINKDTFSMLFNIKSLEEI